MKKCTAVLAALLVTISVAGCSFTKTSSQNSQSAENQSASQGDGKSDTTSGGVDLTKDTIESEDPIENAQYIVSQYMKYANYEYDASMYKLMTPTLAAEYKDMQENGGHDHEYDEEQENMLTDVEFVADREQSEILDSINIPEDYITAVSLTGSVLYRNNGEDKTYESYAIVIETPQHEWQIAYMGTRNLAYVNGILTDELSEKADSNAKTVYEAAQKAYESLDGKYEFSYMNYLSSEDDEFINEIKKNLSDDLKDTSFSVYMTDGELAYVMWSESFDSDVVVRYPLSNLA